MRVPIFPHPCQHLLLSFLLCHPSECKVVSFIVVLICISLMTNDHLMRRSDSLGKNPDAGKNWRQEKKGMTEDEMVGWHHRLDGHEFEQAPGDGEDRKGWRAAVQGVTESQTCLSNWTTTKWLMTVNIFSCAYWPFVYLFWKKCLLKSFWIWLIGSFLFKF